MRWLGSLPDQQVSLTLKVLLLLITDFFLLWVETLWHTSLHWVFEIHWALFTPVLRDDYCSYYTITEDLFINVRCKQSLSWRHQFKWKVERTRVRVIGFVKVLFILLWSKVSLLITFIHIGVVQCLQKQNHNRKIMWLKEKIIFNYFARNGFGLLYKKDEIKKKIRWDKKKEKIRERRKKSANMKQRLKNPEENRIIIIKIALGYCTKFKLL